jgi:hypothetical protein
MQGDRRLRRRAPLQRCRESGAGIQTKLSLVIIATVVGPRRTLDELVEHIFTDETSPPLVALAVKHRPVEQSAGDIDIVIGLPYPADLLRRRGEVLRGELPGVLPTDLLERSTHEFIEVAGDLMPADVGTEALGDTGKVRLHETVPERDQRVGNKIAAVALLRAGLHRLDDTDQAHAGELLQVGTQCLGVADFPYSADDVSMLGTAVGNSSQDACVPGDFSQLRLQENEGHAVSPGVVARSEVGDDCTDEEDRQSSSSSSYRDGGS